VFLHPLQTAQLVAMQYLLSFAGFLFGMTVAIESLSSTTTQLATCRHTNRWLVVDFDNTCTEKDTTPLLPRLAALMHGDDIDSRVDAFKDLENEFFRRYASAKEALCPRTMSLDEALNTLDDISTSVTEKVSSSGLLRGLHAPPNHVLKVIELDTHVNDHVRLRPGCAAALARARKNYKLGVLSINWSRSLIHAALLEQMWSHACKKTNVDDNTDIPIWSNDVDRDGVISLHFPGALAKKAKIINLRLSGYVVYVGDSSTDLSALVEADLGILIGDSKSTISMAKQWGVKVRPLSELHATQREDLSNVLWLAQSWSEIEICLEELVQL
jgi:hypothetical protein